MTTDRPSLRAPELQPLWEAVRARLERGGDERRGRLRVAGLPARGRHLAAALVGGPERQSVDLSDLERALAGLGVGATLPEALATLGFPLSFEPAARRAARRARRDSLAAAREEAARWPERWSGEWVEGSVRAGLFKQLDERGAIALVRNTRAVLDELDRLVRAGAAPVSRADLAASVLGSSHALDTGTSVLAALDRALALRHPGLGRREAWARAGAQSGLVSAPALTWGLHAETGHPLARLLAEARHLETPLHLSQLMLARYPITVAPGSEVLVTENPRPVEAAAQRRLPVPVVSLNGNPSGSRVGAAMSLPSRHRQGCAGPPSPPGCSTRRARSCCSKFEATTAATP
ncbi:MAG TPA: TIGR02679 domain-containing protein [Acidimicrobiales bacterium]|nr:TIGR02679 domain-containing protein [Acidimicrobiales bacterium]